MNKIVYYIAEWLHIMSHSQLVLFTQYNIYHGIPQYIIFGQTLSVHQTARYITSHKNNSRQNCSQSLWSSLSRSELSWLHWLIPVICSWRKFSFALVLVYKEFNCPIWSASLNLITSVQSPCVYFGVSVEYHTTIWFLALWNRSHVKLLEFCKPVVISCCSASCKWHTYRHDYQAGFNIGWSQPAIFSR